MKRFEIIISGEHEEAIGLEILKGIYAAIQNHGYSDVSFLTETVGEQHRREMEIPEFMKHHKESILERGMAAGR